MTERKLSKRAEELLSAPDEDRIRHINESVFIPYPSAASILDEIEDLLEHPKINRMPNILILGRSDNGKTELLTEFLKRHPAEDRKESDTVYAPVVYIQSPPGPSEHLFLDKLLMLLGLVIKPNEASEKKLLRLMKVLQAVQTKVLMVDELNALLAGSIIKQRYFLNMMKYISNELKISIVAAGTLDAMQAINSDKQLSSRFPSRPLPLWQYDKTFRRLLYSFEHILPLKNESQIYKGEIAKKLYGLSEGTIGELSKIIRSASEQAILTRAEAITVSTINECKHVVRKSQSVETVI